MSVQLQRIRNLPPQPTSFIGRTSEISELSALLDHEDCSLLTLVGAGGIGKTRLSIEVASRQIDNFPDGVFFVPLAPLSSTENIVTSIANNIGLHISDEGTPREQLRNFLQERQILLVMDNFEHLLDGVDIMADILVTSAHIKILATSREALNLQEEWVRHITGMRFPDEENIDSIEPYSALKLFMERAHRIRGDFDDLSCAIRICQLVGGMPLAIELATAWLKVMPCDKIIQEIQRNLDFLVTKARNIDDRHRSIRAVFDQSWQLLSDDEQRVLSKLSVFHGGFELEAAEQVAGASLFILTELVEKSLLRVTPSGRYELHELLRQYAQQQLEATGEIETIQDAQSVYYLYFMAEREDDIKGRRQFEGLNEIETDFENVRTAWIHAVSHKNYDALNPTLECLDWFCTHRGRWQEGLELFRSAREGLVSTKGEELHLAWGRIVIRDEGFHGFTPFEDSWKQIEKCLALAKQHGDQREVAYCLNSFGNAMFRMSGDYDVSLHYWSESLALYTELNDAHYVAWLNNRIGLCYGAMKQGDKFFEFMRRSYHLMREKGDHLGVHCTAMNLGLRPENKSNLIIYESEDADVADKFGTWNRISFLVIEQGKLNFFDGDLENAAELISQGLKDLSTLNQPFTEHMLYGKALIVTGLIAGVQEHYSRAKRTFEQIRFSDSTFIDSLIDLGFAIATFGLGDYLTARQHLQSGLAFLFDSQQLDDLLTYIPVAAIFMAHEGKLVQAVELFGLAYHHPSSTTGWLDNWQLLNRVRADLEAELGTDVFESAWERGKNSDLDEAVIRLLAWLNNETSSETNIIDYANQQLIEPLTPRQLEILQLIVFGLDNREISEKLFISILTVKKHINHIFGKLDVSTRAKAIVRAKELHLGS